MDRYDAPQTGTLEVFAYIGVSFIIFSVSVAIVRTMFNRIMEKVPEEKRQNWRNEFRRKFKRGERNNNV